MKNKRQEKGERKGVTAGAGALHAVCVYVCVCEEEEGGGGDGEKGGYEREKKEQATVTADEALWDKHRSCPGRIKERIQMAGAVCCSAPDCSFNGTGQQVPCVSSKGNADILYTRVNTLLESLLKVGLKVEGERGIEQLVLYFMFSCDKYYFPTQISTMNDRSRL